ncbi:hypothetical protein Forpe1208_v011595 [Fusarium oxysporum f. sp. rapae]|uniref:Uncharacterized protein n=1 Tax=Fusarium oxysporum f. sp. rapae TaxID=485398 RepID=A0A8J5NZ90_FUSOX|nr:hypothetical protein Forpe1208_v011595 [Fusarium oxysporum f. sp. rapae]
MATKLDKLPRETFNSIASVSAQVRDAISASLPIGPEEYLTITVPGTDESKHIFPPANVRQAEASLVEAMMPIAKLAVSNERKNVALPGTSKIIVEIYLDKEMKWAEQQQIWEEAKIKATREAEDAFNEGTKDYGKFYKNAPQAEWMDWVINGKKPAVDFTFGMIQMDSMARIESSKESMRNSAIDDPSSDGEVYGVGLIPKLGLHPLNGSDGTTWSRITLSCSASDIQTHESGTIGFGLWTLASANLHEELRREMASYDVRISFSTLVVNIDRPWLHIELFSDTDFEAQRGVKVSPSPSRLHEVIKNQEDDKSGEWAFPAYPTCFIIAADTTIQFTSKPKALEEFWKGGGEMVGYGPWSVSGSAVAEQIRLESTPTGYKISFGAPQIIG